MLYSDDDWEIIRTLIPSWAIVEKSRAATPGKPTMPLPCKVSSARREMAVIARIEASAGGGWAVIRVPGDSGAKVFLIRTGMPPTTAGAIVLGCSTFAPK